MGTDAMLETVKRTIAAYDMLLPGEPVLVALSGGADSTALLHALTALGYPVRACPVNHCLRGAEADRDEAFCRALCTRLHIPLTAERIDVAAACAKGESTEAAARRIRYARLHAAAQGAKIATAHTAEDNLETVLFHLVRGTGPKGLTGIPPVRDRIIRPLIEVERAQIERYLAAIGQDYVTDSTNAADVYTRNRIRHTVVPALRRINPAVCGAAVRLGTLLRQDEEFLLQQARALLTDAARADGAFDTAPLVQAHPAVRTRALRCMAAQAGMPLRDLSAQHIAAWDALLTAQTPSAVCTLPHGWQVRREYGAVRLTQAESPCVRPVLPLTVPFDRMIWDGTLRLQVRYLEKDEVFYKTFNTFCVDCGTIDFASLCVRTRRTGDRICLSEKGGSRTLKKRMIDCKIPRVQRDQLAVIADKNGVIAVQDIGVDCARLPQGGARIQIQIEGYGTWHMI